MARPTSGMPGPWSRATTHRPRSEEHTSELQSRLHLVCRLLLEKKKKTTALPFATCAFYRLDRCPRDTHNSLTTPPPLPAIASLALSSFGHYMPDESTCMQPPL